jgi:hypothetical protein
VLKTKLEHRIVIVALGEIRSWPQILSDLDALTETAIAQDGKRFLVRLAPRAAASLALRAAGVAPPPTVRPAERARNVVPRHRHGENCRVRLTALPNNRHC